MRWAYAKGRKRRPEGKVVRSHDRKQNQLSKFEIDAKRQGATKKEKGNNETGSPAKFGEKLWVVE